MDGFGSVKGFPLKASSFLQVSSSSDNSKIAFVVLLAETFHADSAGWEGMLDCKANRVIQLGVLDKDILWKITLSSSGRYLVTEYDYSSVYPFEEDQNWPVSVINTKNRRAFAPIGNISRFLSEADIVKLGWNKISKDEYIGARFIKFSTDEKLMYFKFIRMGKWNISLDKGNDRDLGIWVTNVKGTLLRKNNDEK